MVKIYTKTGDKGKTSLFGGRRVSKNNLIIEVLGEIDELNSAIGVALAELSIKYKVLSINKELIEIQKDLFEIGALIANPSSASKNLPGRISTLEKMIDELTKELPELSNFILPGGNRAGSILHFARSVCRRAERKAVALSEKEKVDQNILSYFNRLSDLIFVFARFINYKEKEIIIG